MFRNLGKLKSECETAAEALNVTFYPLPKIHGTRFVNHRRRGFDKLLHNWPVLITAFTNTLATDCNCRGETRAKVEGILRKLRSYKFICQTAVYLDILDAIGPLALMFKADFLMAYDVLHSGGYYPLSNLEDLRNEELDDSIDSYLRKFTIMNDNEEILTARYAKAGHERKKTANREYIDVTMENVNFVNDESINSALALRAEGIKILTPLIRERFKSFTENEMFQLLTWLDPQYWEDDKRYGF